MGRTARLPRPRAVRRVLEDRRALPDRRHERGAHRVRHAGAVPVDADISSLRFPMVGASPLPATVRDDFRAHTGTALIEGYGLTEATCASARSFPDVSRPGSVGQRLPYQRIPVTAVGKLHKPALRTDAIRREVRAALDKVPEVLHIKTTTEGSSIVATVTVSPSADQAAIKAVLGRYAIEWRLVVVS
ncbi:AMP-binding protein [Micromonospora phytophila]|uniref:AMP-binding protein n=1 Tax=Micromonospora phytophila TaxID=709888 RepID=UPI00202EEFF4|nr:AMP-binding protein [Micromonospora phytophila]MCM0673291.1 AMP-binding protein [Micromonospora phytophila]